MPVPRGSVVYIPPSIRSINTTGRQTPIPERRRGSHVPGHYTARWPPASGHLGHPPGTGPMSPGNRPLPRAAASGMGAIASPGNRFHVSGEPAASPGGRQRCMGVVLGTVRRWGAARGHGWPPGCYLWGVWFCRRVFPYHGSGFSLSYLSRLNRFCCCRLSVFHLLSTSCASSWGYCSAKSGRSIS